MTDNTKLAKDLKPGDKVLDANHKALTVGWVGKGIGPRMVMIDWKEGDWSNIDRNSTVYLAEPQKGVDHGGKRQRRQSAKCDR